MIPSRPASPLPDRVLLGHLLPPQAGIVLRIRFGSRGVSVLWALPIAFVLLVIGVAVAQALRQMPGVQAFLLRYPGIPASAHAVDSGFPAWLRLTHFLNLFFMAFIIRADIQVLADHPCLRSRPMPPPRLPDVHTCVMLPPAVHPTELDEARTRGCRRCQAT